MLGANHVDFVGLWYAVPGGPHDLRLSAWRVLADAALATTGLSPVLVTFAKDAAVLGKAIGRYPRRGIQLHGYPRPGVVRKVNPISPEVHVIKVLHVRDGECVKASLPSSYERAGGDVFLFDTVTDYGRVGSTGQSLKLDTAVRS